MSSKQRRRWVNSNTSYSTLHTPNARMRENYCDCSSDNYQVKKYNENGQPYRVRAWVNSNSAVLQWNFPNMNLFDNYEIKVSICGTTLIPYMVMRTSNSICQFKLEPGTYYEITVNRISDNFLMKIRIKATFSFLEINQLYSKAATFLFKSNSRMQVVCEFFRCKPSGYFEELDFNTMVPYIKNLTGHSASPINKALRGLFFSTKLYDGFRPTKSPYGSKCIPISASLLFDPRTTNAYFADFFCNLNKSHIHHVIIVLCSKGSDSDAFCYDHLRLLDPFNNPFLQVKFVCEKLAYFVATGVFIDLFVTSPVKFAPQDLYDVFPIGSGTSNKIGLPNRSNCVVCNL